MGNLLCCTDGTVDAYNIEFQSEVPSLYIPTGRRNAAEEVIWRNVNEHEHWRLPQHFSAHRRRRLVVYRGSQQADWRTTRWSPSCFENGFPFYTRVSWSCTLLHARLLRFRKLPHKLRKWCNPCAQKNINVCGMVGTFNSKYFNTSLPYAELKSHERFNCALLDLFYRLPITFISFMLHLFQPRRRPMYRWDWWRWTWIASKKIPRYITGGILFEVLSSPFTQHSHTGKQQELLVPLCWSYWSMLFLIFKCL